MKAGSAGRKERIFLPTNVGFPAASAAILPGGLSCRQSLGFAN